MSRLRAAAGSLVFLVVAPGATAGLVPWLLTGWDSSSPADSSGFAVALQIAGWVVLVPAVAVLVAAFGRFVVEGIGTPAPVAPPDRLVVGGLYRWVRNPMYLAVAAVILGQAAILGSWSLVGYAAAFMATVWAFVHWYEEPALRRRFGAAYEEYLRAVPGWWPRRPRT